MAKAVIAGYSRSPFTIANKGDLVSVRPEDLLAEVIKDLVIKSKINPEDMAFIQYTSGTITDPKPIKVRHKNLIHNLETIEKTLFLDHS